MKQKINERRRNRKINEELETEIDAVGTVDTEEENVETETEEVGFDKESFKQTLLDKFNSWKSKLKR